MVSYFAEQLSEQASRGVTNTVTDVRLESGDLAQAWAEAGREYATVAMRFSMIDVTRDGSGGWWTAARPSGSLATEIWTFVRSRGGHWILSAIQQAGRMKVDSRAREADSRDARRDPCCAHPVHRAHHRHGRRLRTGTGRATSS